MCGGMKQYRKGGCKGVGPGQTSPHFPFLAREWRMPEVGERVARDELRGSGTQSFPTP